MANEAVIREALALWEAFSPGTQPTRVFFAPGRVNLIGEHTDYNGGFVFPAALSLGTWVFVRPRGDGLFRFASSAFPEQVTVTKDELQFVEAHGFANYPKGVLWVMQQEGITLPSGADFLFAGNLPNGAGLSSSASVELVTAAAVRALAHDATDTLTLVRWAQRAENEFVGVNCGIMDQYAVGMGRAGQAMLLDCATLACTFVPIILGDYRLMITNTNARRGLADSKYNERRAECDAAVAMLQAAQPGLRYLAELTPATWAASRRYVTDPVLARRVEHVVTEHDRTKRAADCLASGDLLEFGRLMTESHVSLRDEYEVTGRALDSLAEAAWTVDGCVGSRMTGAGFGGCTVSLVHKDSIPAFCAVLTERYHAETGLTPTFYESQIGDGVHEVTEEVFA